MSVYVSGGGSGSSTAAVGAGGYNNLALLTTPNVTNTAFIMVVNWGTTTDNQKTVINSIPLGICQGSAGARTMAMGGSGCIFRVGGNVAVTISLGNSSTVAGAIVYAYNYVSIVMDTN